MQLPFLQYNSLFCYPFERVNTLIINDEVQDNLRHRICRFVKNSNAHTKNILERLIRIRYGA